MSVQLDPIIAEKLEDFRRRRRNLIILRGICTAIVTLLGVFSTIAIADYLSQARMPDELRTTLSYAGYAVVVLAVWRDLRQASVGVAQSQKTRPLDRANRARNSGKIFFLPWNWQEKKAWKAIRKSFASSCKKTFLLESGRST